MEAWQKKGQGLVFIISAPSGTGKTTLVRKVMEEVPGLRFGISYTTRSPRTNERDGEDYCFVTPDVFQKMIDEDGFLEWADVLGHRYGTPRTWAANLATEGMDLLLDIDTQGAKQVKEKIGEAILLYLFPPSLGVLEQRLVGRGLDAPERIRFRLANARKDMEEARGYDYIIVNDRVQETLETLKAIIRAERCRKAKGEILEGRLKR